MAKGKNKSLPLEDIKKSVPPDVDDGEVYRKLYSDQLALAIRQFSEIQKFMATKEDLANLETRITDKIHQELKPLGKMETRITDKIHQELTPLKKLQGEFRMFIKVFYGAVAAAVIGALFKIVFPG